MSTPTPGGFSLFPSPNMSKPPTSRNQTPRGRRSESRERRAVSPGPAVAAPEITPAASPPPREARPQHQHQGFEFDFQQPQAVAGPSSSQALPAYQPPERSVSRSSIAKPPLVDDPSAAGSDLPLRSIFPTYNPDVPLNQQNYVPTQMSPTHIPRAVISRQTYHQDVTNGPISPPLRSPMSIDHWQGPGPRPRPAEAPAMPEVCSTEQLRSLWKVANGWKASQSEGRVYCLRLTQEKDAPVYTLSSAGQPFYHVRVDPTSVSARVTVARFDPNKTYKTPRGTPDPSASSSSILSTLAGSKSGDGSKHWQESLTTTLEEEARRHRPEDGLVALLVPSPAMKMAADKAEDPNAVMMAERECARLVWDDDSNAHYLVHPALATPFCVTIERSPAWGRVEYTLEHNESPQHLAKLTRDSTGTGWLELDTAIAAHIESFFLVDVAVTALMIVAQLDEKNVPVVEAFEPPPPVFLPPGEERRLSKASKASNKKKRKMEPFEIDVESQNSSLRKPKARSSDGEDKLPFLIRVVVKIIKALFSCFIWVLTIGFKVVLGVFKGLYKCIGSKY